MLRGFVFLFGFASLWLLWLLVACLTCLLPVFWLFGLWLRVACDLWVLGLVVADGMVVVWCWCGWLFGDLLIV